MSISEPVRPPLDAVQTAVEFRAWYWSVDDLQAFCRRLGVAASGRKAELRARVEYAFSHLGHTPPATGKRPKRSGFPWARAELAADTVITADISFGPNVRRYFSVQIGPAFVCHSDFMDWVKDNPGRTLGDAVEAWRMLEARKEDPDFRREIAACNEYLQYLRDYRDANPESELAEAKACWDQKKLRPAENGRVRYAADDLRFRPSSTPQP